MNSCFACSGHGGFVAKGRGKRRRLLGVGEGCHRRYWFVGVVKVAPELLLTSLLKIIA